MTPEQASHHYHWCRYNAQTKTIELFLDHHVLSTLRTCESLFLNEHLLNIRPKYGTGRKPWFLDFGSFMHDCYDVYYKSLKDGKVIEIIEWLNYAKKLWLEMKMNEYGALGNIDQDKYEDIGGWDGVASLLIQYYTFYMDLRVRVIDTEISFGQNREVPLGTFQHFLNTDDYNDYPYNINCYLTGRIDLLIDNGNKIGPVDHKHTHRFKGDEWTKFNPQDAITGYILAINSIMQQSYPKYYEQGRQCLSAWVYHISACSPSKSRKTGELGPRFKATPIDKDLSQLEDYKARQLTTFKRICAILFNDETPQWNTNACHNIFNRRCPMLPIHEAPSREWNHIIADHYEIGEAWNPNKRTENVEKTTEVLSAGTPTK
jgi:hypothetical protein